MFDEIQTPNFVGPLGPGRGLAHLGFRDDQNHYGFIAHRNTS